MKLLGAAIGDIVGSTREWKNVKKEEFELLPQCSRFTDDTVMTTAIAEWLGRSRTHRSHRRMLHCTSIGQRAKRLVKRQHEVKTNQMFFRNAKIGT